MKNDLQMRGRLTDANAIRRFIEAGNATLTVASTKTGSRFTFKFSRPDAAATQVRNHPFKTRPIWVRLLSGPDNDGDYSYVGALWPPELDNLRMSSKSKVGPRAPSVAALRWFLHQLYHGKGNSANLAQAEVWHEGRCGRCGRNLTVPQSIASGFGPDCMAQMEVS